MTLEHEPTVAAPRWSIFTNHGHVLLFLVGSPEARVRDIAEAVGITQRTAQVILRDLKHARYISSTSTGRRKHYQVATDRQLHHSTEKGLTLGALLAAVTSVSRVPNAQDSSGS